MIIELENPTAMSIDYNQILLFKTNIRSEDDKKRVQTILDSHEKIHEWNVDSEDVDCVLRIVSHSLTHDLIINEIEKLGFQCNELI